MATTRQLTTQPEKEELARHELAVGLCVVSFSTGSGKSETCTATDLGKLDAHIGLARA